MNGLPLGIRRLAITAPHSPEGLKSQAFRGWGLFCDSAALATQSEGLVPLTVGAFNAVIEHLLCAPPDPSLWQGSKQSQ